MEHGSYYLCIGTFLNCFSPPENPCFLRMPQSTTLRKDDSASWIGQLLTGIIPRTNHLRTKLTVDSPALVLLVKVFQLVAALTLLFDFHGTLAPFRQSQHTHRDYLALAFGHRFVGRCSKQCDHVISTTYITVSALNEKKDERSGLEIFDG